ncbi:tobamovirus multiplication protein 1-like isoform x1 [Anaeramoeba flamelloides]|uniref:Tobamovirus multiplication protein 1-like isoform x1 n=1 Tax=Anaeramoeba flamelloides TaxID=1746091 RepID=A0AAV7ZVT8_9EUKA|nr:tobamovirus multiplication protein 1-like isoform x1 [Anaeramoeba flamelloides]
MTLQHLLTLTALNTHSGVLYFLGILFFFVGLFCLIDFYRNFRNYRFNTQDSGSKYRSLILFFSAWLMIQRGVMTFSSTKQNWFIIYLFHQCIPLYLQFSIFSFFVLLLTTKIFSTLGNENLIKNLAYPIFYFLHIFSIIGMVVYALIRNHYPPTIKNYLTGNYIFVTVVFGLLSFFNLFFVIRMFQIQKKFTYRFSHDHKINQTISLMCLLSVIYFSETVWSFLCLVNGNPLNDKLNHELKKQNPSYYVFILVWFLITEIIPVVVIYFVFHLSFQKSHKSSLYNKLEGKYIPSELLESSLSSSSSNI